MLFDNFYAGIRFTYHGNVYQVTGRDYHTHKIEAVATGSSKHWIAVKQDEIQLYDCIDNVGILLGRFDPHYDKADQDEFWVKHKDIEKAITEMLRAIPYFQKLSLLKFLADETANNIAGDMRPGGSKEGGT